MAFGKTYDDFKDKASTTTERALALAAAAIRGKVRSLKLSADSDQPAKVVMRTTEKIAKIQIRRPRALFGITTALISLGVANAFVVSCWITAEAGIEWADVLVQRLYRLALLTLESFGFRRYALCAFSAVLIRPAFC